MCYVQVASCLVQSRASRFFKMLITSGRLKGRGATVKNWDTANHVKLQEIVSDKGVFKKRLLLRAKHTGAWLRVRGTMVTVT